MERVGITLVMAVASGKRALHHGSGAFIDRPDVPRRFALIQYLCPGDETLEVRKYSEPPESFPRTGWVLFDE